MLNLTSIYEHRTFYFWQLIKMHAFIYSNFDFDKFHLYDSQQFWLFI